MTDRCHSCATEAHPPMIDGKPTCLACKLASSRDKPIVERRRGRKPADLSKYVYKRIGKRTITGVEWVRHAGYGSRQMLRVECMCGSSTLAFPSAVNSGDVRACKKCDPAARVGGGRRPRDAAPVAVVPPIAAAREPRPVCDCTYYGGRLVRPCSSCRTRPDAGKIRHGCAG